MKIFASWPKQRIRPAEKARLIHLLVQQIEYDGEAEEIGITYHPGVLEEEVAHA